MQQRPSLPEIFNYCPYDGYKFTTTDTQCLLCKRIRGNMTKQIDPPKKAAKKWSKVLYESRGHEDNYFDETFLSSLVQKNNRSNIQLREVIEKTLDVTWAINIVAIFLLIFHYMKSSILSEGVLISVVFISSMVCTFLFIIISKNIIKTQTIFKNIKRTLFLVCALFFLSPIMKTVNETYADNTTYALSIGLIIFHLIFKDYSAENTCNVKDWNCNSSTLAAFAFSSFLGSRLNNDFQVFTLLFSFLILFFYASFFKKEVKDFSATLYKSWNFISSVILFFMILNVSKILGFLFLLGQIFITFICPMWLIWLYQYKRTFHGPWDLPEGIQVKD
ncbi:hypothetical protein ABPG74_018326 [Tetrahymena malaccensis]